MPTKLQHSAYHKVRKAVKNGLLIRKNCECESQKLTVAHHDDYNKPLDVKHLCRKCHAHIHGMRVILPDEYESEMERVEIIENVWTESIHVINNERYIKGTLRTAIA